MKKSSFKFSILISLLLLTAILFSSCSLMSTGSASTGDEKYITNAYINSSGELVLCYSNGTKDNVGVVVGQNGENGQNGQDGQNGKDGADGKDGKDGKDGVNGQDGKDGAILSDSSSSVPLEISIANCLQSAVIVECAFKTSLSSVENDSFSSGSGIIYSCNKTTGDAIIVTNYHVVFENRSLTVDGISEDINVYLYGTLSEDKAMEATYIGGSMTYDVAVLKISNSEVLKTHEISPVRIRSSNEIHVGEPAFAIGNPMGEGFSVTSGIISVDSEVVEIPASDKSSLIPMRLLRTDAAVNSGNSGGGLFDENGYLIALVNAKIIDDGIENVGYAIPSSTLCGVVENILDNCSSGQYRTLRRAQLGITIQVTNPYTIYNSETGYVDLYESSTIVEVSNSGLAYNKLLVGDIVKEVSISGSCDMSVTVTRQYMLLDIILHARIGDTVTVTVERNGNTHTEEFLITPACISNS